MESTSRRPTKAARSLAIDLLDMSAEQLTTIGNALSNVLSLSNAFIDGRRVRYFRLELIEMSPITQITFKSVGGQQFGAVRDKLKALAQNVSQFQTAIGRNIAITNLAKNIRVWIHQSVADKPPDVEWIDVTLVSAREETEVVRHMCRALSAIDCSHLINVSIICFKRAKGVETGNGLANGESFKIPDRFQTLIQSETINCSEMNLQTYFKGWFHEPDVMMESVHIVMGDEECSHTVIKCDLREAIVDVNRVRVKGAKFDLNSDCHVETVPPSILAGRGVKGVHRLAFQGLVAVGGLSESVVFGVPNFLTPTRNVSLGFNELKRNCEQFNGLIKVMLTDNAMMVLELLRDSPAPKAMFAVLASPDAKSLLLKPIAGQELMLPFANHKILDQQLYFEAPPETVESIRRLMGCHQLAKCYNPFVVKHNLYDYL